jgi:uncharacterized protein
MKRIDEMFIIQFALFLLIYLAICYYIGFNGWVWLRETFSFRYKKAYIICISFLSLSFFLDRLGSARVLAYISGSWLLIVGYGLILLPVANLIYFLLKKRGVKVLGGVIISFFILVFVFGSYNAWNPVVRSYDLKIDKPSYQEDLSILMVSDLHLGKTVGKNHLERLVELTKEQQPDIVLIAGDIIDDYILPYLDENMGEAMKQIKAPLGVYATSGNHDYYGDDLDILHKEMEKAGIHMLADESVNIQNSFYVVGRNDLTDKNRKSMEELVKNLDKNQPIIMLDHQPNEIKEASANDVDVLLSGHTHGGQVAPANIITNLLYENDWGHLQKGSLHSIVSSGFGLWGPPFRIGTRSEVVMVNLQFNR